MSMAMEDQIGRGPSSAERWCWTIFEVRTRLGECGRARGFPLSESERWMVESKKVVENLLHANLGEVGKQYEVACWKFCVRGGFQIFGLMKWSRCNTAT